MQKDSFSYENIATELALGSIKSIEVIQELWSGYGKLLRLNLENKSIIIKHIKFPKTLVHPRAWNTDFSHQRKIKSYEVEVYWYEKYTSLIDERCRVPRSLKTFQSKNEWLIVMEDLSNIGFPIVTMNANKNHLKSCLFWLANFHAKYLNIKDEKLWKVGTYWHLDTRPDEFELLEDKKLKKYAKLIDKKLNDNKYQTIVHGDAKLANFCFNFDGTKCAAVDFQYIGSGCGMKDLVYFMSSAIKPEDCFSLENWVLDTYFEFLNNAIKYYNPKFDAYDVQKEWRRLFCIAWADFLRFMKAWSPKHYKINKYSEDISNRALKYLES